jgi:uncharacterized protein YndB with AHSA1/START domain
VRGVDDVFRALADPTRRSVLDALFARDGQTLTELEQLVPMTRFGVMKHLRVLEDAGLVATRRRGREKLHFLNVVPIRLVHDRWVSKFAEPWAAALTGIKASLEEEHTMEQVFEIYIKATPAQVWEAITDSAMHARYSFGVGFDSELTPGSRYVASTPRMPGDGVVHDGEILEVDPPHRLVHTHHARWSPEVEAVGPTRVTWEVEQVGDSCKVVVTHDQLPEGANEQLYGGWPQLLSGLKTLLETGEQLTTPGSLMYAGD